MAIAKADALARRVGAHRKDMVELLSGLIRIPALGPRNGGPGERAKADWVARYCRAHGFSVDEYTAPDRAVESGGRPNLVVKTNGSRGGRTLWVMTHLDVVPPGDESLWKTPPFKPVLRKGRLYGRGSEDNGQSLAAAFWALKSMREERRRPEFDVGLLFVADEETGSKKGISWLLGRHRKLFTKRDLILVPDGGDPKGERIEVSEKSILWVRITVHGVQCHGSMPYLGKNAARAAARISLALDEQLHRKYPAKDPLFMPPESTFEPTRHDGNVPNINTIPGRDVFHFDCRVLPRYNSNSVLSEIRRIAAREAKRLGCRVEVEAVQHDRAAPPTSPKAEIVRRLSAAIQSTRGLRPKVWGVGGGTVAAIFRRKGFPAAVWSTYDECAHAPNEYAVIDNIVADAKVYAALFSQPEDGGTAR